MARLTAKERKLVAQKLLRKTKRELKIEFYAIRKMSDVTRMAKRNPIRFMRWDLKQRLIADLQKKVG